MRTHLMTVLKTAVPFVLLLLCAACNDVVEVTGMSSIVPLEGRMLYLCAYADEDLKAIDSCRVQDGHFAFRIQTDSVMMVHLFVGNESLMPMVLDASELSVILTDEEHRVTGSAMNDSLFAFIRLKNTLEAQMHELPHRETRMILNGLEQAAIAEQLEAEMRVIKAQEDLLVMNFIKQNMDNVMGAGVFMIVTSSFPYPILNPQIDELAAEGTTFFLSDAYVSTYLAKARENMNRLH